MANPFVNSSMHRRNNNCQAGLSLVEVLVVLVILLLGIYSAIRLFPLGFGVINSASNATAATRLGQQLLNSLKPGEGVPEGVYVSYVDNTTGNTMFMADQMPDDMSPFAPTGPNGQSAQLNAESADMNKWHYIDRETFTVPATKPPNGSPIWIPNFAPIQIPAAASGNNTIGKYITAISSNWKQIAGNSSVDPSTNLPVSNPDDYLSGPSGQSTYLIDYAAGKIALPLTPYNETVHLHVIDSGGVPRDIDLPVIGTTTSSATSATWGDATTYPTVSWPSAPWLAGSATVYRPIALTTASWSADPYEFKLLSGNIGSSDANIGTIAINPLALTANAGKPLQVKLSYIAYDWHILHEDRDVAAGQSIRTTLRDLKKAGDIQVSGKPFTGLFTNQNQASANYELAFLDLDTGTLVPGLGSVANVHDADENQGASASASGVLNVSFTNGRITLPDTGVTSSHIRVFYAGRQDWGVCVQMSPAVFHYTTGSLMGPWSTVPSVYTLPPTGATIRFAPGDAGKQVVVTGLTYTDTTNTVQTVAQLNLSLPTTVDPVTGLVIADLTDPSVTNGTPLASADQTKPISVKTVTGVSMRALVVWREHGAWKRRTLETNLPRA